MNYNYQLRILYQERQKVKESPELYFELDTESGIIQVPKKVVLKAFRSSIEHFKSRIQYEQSLKKEKNDTPNN